MLTSAIIAVTLAIGHAASAQKPSPAQTPGIAKHEGVAYGTVITVHGKIAKVNKAAKQVTLTLSEGKELTLDVRNQYNLDAVKVGDPYLARYYEMATIRKKQPGENVPTASLKSGIATASPGGVPGAVGTMHVTLLVTVDAIDRANDTVTVKAPDGTAETVRARNPGNLKHLKAGDQLVVSISRAIGITLQSESGKAAS